MAVASDAQLQPQRRLHPLSWLFALLAFLRQFVVPLLVALLFGARNDYEMWGLLAAGPLLVGALWHQYFYRYDFGPHELVIREGVLFRSLRRIDFSRIVNIDTLRGPLHRLFGVAEVKIETSAGGKAEALIRVLGPQALRELRERVFGSQEAGEAGETTAASDAAQAPPAPLLHLPPGELVRFGLIDNRGVLIAAAAAGTVSQMGLDETLGRAAMQLLPGAVNEVGNLVWPLQAALAVAVILGALLLLRLLSIVLALLTLYDFRLTRKGADLRVQYGLLTRVALTLRQQRIQAVRQTESFLHRMFDRVSLQVDLAGDAQEGNEQQADRIRWLAPVTTPAQASQLIATALPQFDLATPADWHPLAAGARRRVFRRTAFVATLFLAPTAWFLHFYVLLAPLVTIPLAAFHARQYVRYTRWAITPEVLLFRHGWLTRRLVIAPRNRVQSVGLEESPFDRRHGMASVAIDAAGGSAHTDLVRIPYLELQTARELASELYRPLRHSAAANTVTVDDAARA